MSPMFVSAALSRRAQRRGAARLLVAGHHLVEIALAHERAFLELGDVEAEQLLADRILVAARKKLGRHLAAVGLEDPDRAALEVAVDAQPPRQHLELQLDSERTALPRPPPVARRQHAVRAAVVLQAVERRRDRGEQRGLAALVVVDDQVQPVGRESPLAAQRAEAVDLQAQQLHDTTSSPSGETSRRRNASSPRNSARSSTARRSGSLSASMRMSSWRAKLSSVVRPSLLRYEPRS